MFLLAFSTAGQVGNRCGRSLLTRGRIEEDEKVVLLLPLCGIVVVWLVWRFTGPMVDFCIAHYM